MNIAVIIIGFAIVFLLAYSGSISKDVQRVKRFVRGLLFAMILFPVFAQAQYWGKFEPVCSIHANDPDQIDNEVYYTITAGNTEKMFVITPCTGIIKHDTSVYSTFTRSKTYYLTCRATDQGGLYSVKKLKIVLTKTANRRNPPQFYVL